jgi:hypothetical protein
VVNNFCKFCLLELQPTDLEKIFNLVLVTMETVSFLFLQHVDDGSGRLELQGLHSVWPELFHSHIALAENNFQEWKLRYIGQQYLFSVVRHLGYRREEQLRVDQFAPINISSTLNKYFQD